ncbi:hypothetical protein [Deinococcus gobiensis]|uniref:Uncharacterized protein n=1 Tax=Deinococcus gobiensis (strain DSM 21396 / JCM 16679 / CGMCC 1.7299 / I-0) TaxID=745776 RepID=H8GXN7_DEIGI|nr:hypothetical protein [Deinococcus gobiensis]AFD25889.1 hypothetical protein DGo_CA1962 [Deinococcus gobiensis I-0]
MTPLNSLSQNQRIGIGLLLLFIVVLPKQTDTLWGQVLHTLLTVGAMVGFLLILPRIQRQPIPRWARALMWAAAAWTLWVGVQGVYWQWKIDQLRQLTP